MSNINTSNNNSSSGTKRRSRTCFTKNQLDELEKVFGLNPYPDSNVRRSLMDALNMKEHIIMIWFKNRRAKHRRCYKTGCPNGPQPYIRGPYPMYDHVNSAFVHKFNISQPITTQLSEIYRLPYTVPYPFNQPLQPIQPNQPPQPNQPLQPNQPNQPLQPIQPHPNGFPPQFYPVSMIAPQNVNPSNRTFVYHNQENPHEYNWYPKNYYLPNVSNGTNVANGENTNFSVIVPNEIITTYRSIDNKENQQN